MAIIMDGNGRWAAKRGLPRSLGHKKGAERVQEIARAAGEMGIKYLTLYAFSTENWQRSAEEVDALMGLLRQYLKSELSELQKNGVRHYFYRRTGYVACRYIRGNVSFGGGNPE